MHSQQGHSLENTVPCSCRMVSSLQSRIACLYWHIASMTRDTWETYKACPHVQLTLSMFMISICLNTVYYEYTIWISYGPVARPWVLEGRPVTPQYSRGLTRSAGWHGPEVPIAAFWCILALDPPKPSYLQCFRCLVLPALILSNISVFFDQCLIDRDHNFPVTIPFTGMDRPFTIGIVGKVLVCLLMISWYLVCLVYLIFQFLSFLSWLALWCYRVLYHIASFQHIVWYCIVEPLQLDCNHSTGRVKEWWITHNLEPCIYIYVIYIYTWD